MAAIFKLFFCSLLVVLTASTIASMGNARPLQYHDSSPKPSNLAARLKLDGESSLTCWDSLIQIQACTGEIILFFLNGETYLGHGCCDAIREISHRCWPNMIGTLGYTTEEGDILEGYCDKSNDDDDDHDHDDGSRSSSPSLEYSTVNEVTAKGN